MAKNTASKSQICLGILHKINLIISSFRVYEELLHGGILEPLKLNINNSHEHEAGTKHYISPNGMSSLVKYFINKYECKPEFEHHISSITKMNEKWYLIHRQKIKIIMVV